VVAGEARGGKPARGGETALMCGFYVDLDFESLSILSWVTWCCYWQFLIILIVSVETNAVSVLLCEISWASLPTLCRLT
jgi:hypothetical protein